MIKDTFGRIHDYLRISLTDHCNLRCTYCMPNEHYRFLPNRSLMQADEILSIAQTFVSLGVKKIRLTGGEPLLRKDAGRIIENLSTLPIEMALTTNATRVHAHMVQIRKANFSSINVSLDTLRADRFFELTKRKVFTEVMDNIHMLSNEGYNVKVNVVVMRGVNDDEIIDFVEWTKDVPIQVRFIEFMPFSGNAWTKEKTYTLAEMLAVIEQKYTLTPIDVGIHSTSKEYDVDGHQGSFGVISTMSKPFCGGCNRIRLTADGKVKNCLFSKKEIDILTPYRQGQDIVPIIQDTIRAKKKELGGQFSTDLDSIDEAQIRNRSMISIGG